ncbi:NAD(P)H-dependent oxidoreductase [Sphingopyxis sp. BSN-002]|uniref:NADPH-dependent FMN reductase n=1 Tax=Sphingopyxis sp. BSN-002 TaxID=2911495 RepID=UPI001EDA3E7F|nr:NAD(P)H-dependent oxidoreductase [Sphingopyxis sp. BSN-002]UKK84447.1 NAD(P)H-dependent oxidoreductase [Sphingopyxis sp. BSN-002]
MIDRPVSAHRPRIVALGGNATAGGSAERLLRHALARCEAEGAETSLFAGDAIDLPLYAPHRADRCDKAQALTEALRDADGIIVASPAYHGTVSGVVKNALDYAQDLVSDTQPYFDGRAVGLVAVAGGWQAAGSTLATLRSITHALRGWPTPMAVTANSSQPLFDPDGLLTDDGIAMQLDIMTSQVMMFARMKAGYAAARAAETV